MPTEELARPTNVHAEIYKDAVDVAKKLKFSKKWMLERSLELFIDANSKRRPPTNVRWTPRSTEWVRPRKVNKRLYDKAVNLARKHSLAPHLMLEEGMAILIQVYSRTERKRRAKQSGRC